MSARSSAVLASLLVVACGIAKADTVINLNATTGSAQTGGVYANNLAPSFFSTFTLGPGSYSLSLVGAGYTGSNGVTSVYNGWSYALSPAGHFSEIVGVTSNGSFSNSSAANGYQNSYTVGTTPDALGPYLWNTGGTYSDAATALATSIGSPYLFSLATATSLTLYIADGSFLPTFNYNGYDDNTGGVSLDLKNLTAVTPEPSSLLLLATGTLAAAGALKRRIRIS